MSAAHISRHRGGLLLAIHQSFTRGAPTWIRRSKNAKRASVVKGAGRLAKAHARAAQSRSSTSTSIACLPAPRTRPLIHVVAQMKAFSLSVAVKSPHGRPSAVEEVEPAGSQTVFAGDRPRRLTSVDGYDLLYHLPGGLNGRNLVRPTYLVRLPLRNLISYREGGTLRSRSPVG